LLVGTQPPVYDENYRPASPYNWKVRETASAIRPAKQRCHAFEVRSVADEFDPYRAWLGLECGTRSPDYYQLLGISRREADMRLIIAAGDRAMARVRAHRPGRNAAAWARLLDEIAAAKQCLTDAAERHRYDQQLAPDAAESGRREKSSPNPAEDLNFFPPGYSKHGVRRGTQEPAEEKHVDKAPAESADDFVLELERESQSPESGVRSPESGAESPGHGRGNGPSSPHPASGNRDFIQLDEVPSSKFHEEPHGFGQAESDAEASSGVPLSAFVELVDQSPEEAIAAVTEAAKSRVRFEGLDRESAASPESPRSKPETGDVFRSSQSDWAGRAGSLRVGRSEPVARRRSISPLLMGIAMGFVLLIVAAIAAYFGRRPEQSPHVPTNPLAVLPGDQLTGQADISEPPRRSGQQPTHSPAPVADVGRQDSKEDDRNSEEAKPEEADKVRSAQPESPSGATGEARKVPEVAAAPNAQSEQPKPAEVSPDDPTGMGPMPGYAAPSAAGLSDDEFRGELRRARAAVGECNFALAGQAISRAESSAVDDRRKEQVAAMQTLAEHVRVFDEAVRRAASTLPAASEISLGEQSVAIVVETGPDHIVVRAEGKNRRFRHADMPLGLEVALGAEVMGQDEGASRVYKAAYVLVSPKAGADDKRRATGWLQEVQAGTPAARKILTAVSDSR
jgi:hypothetical protein